MSNNKVPDRPPIAAIEIGTNSAQLIISTFNDQGELTILDSHKAVLRLGEALSEEKMLSDQAITNTIIALKHMQSIAASYSPIYRVVATHATRLARNHKEFFQSIYDETGLYLSLIAGEEEARLTSLGMQEGLPLENKTFLGVDIGGGSTEIVICKGDQISYVTSLDIGSVILNKKFLSHDKIKKPHLKSLETEISLRLSSLRDDIKSFNFDCAVISSGAAKTIASIHSQEFLDEKLEDPNGYHLKREDIEFLHHTLKKFRSPEAIKNHWELDADRAKIILAGSSILTLLTQLLNVNEWIVSSDGLREGLVLDTISRLHGPLIKGSQDVRWKNILNLGRKYNINNLYADKVTHLSLEIFDQIGQKTPDYVRNGIGVQISDRGILKAAAWLHECGKFIGFPKYHKHSLYLIANSRLMGFSEKERRLIGLVCRFHRKGKANQKNFDCSDLNSKECKRVNYLASILRVAAAANRSRQGLIKTIHLRWDSSKLDFIIETTKKVVPEVDFYKLSQEKKLLEELLETHIYLKIRD